jgi:hypothetical protein
MMAVDGNTPDGISSWLLLAGTLAGVALATSVAAFATVHTILALSRRVALALAAEHHVMRRGEVAPAFVRRRRAATITHRVALLAVRRGLRAPPIFGR